VQDLFDVLDGEVRVAAVEEVVRVVRVHHRRLVSAFLELPAFFKSLTRRFLNAYFALHIAYLLFTVHLLIRNSAP